MIWTGSKLHRAQRRVLEPSYDAGGRARGRIGAVGYFLLTGKPPFGAANVMETLKHVLEQEPVSPRRVNDTVDLDLETICLKCLRKEPEKRYASAAELAAVAPLSTSSANRS